MRKRLTLVLIVLPAMAWALLAFTGRCAAEKVTSRFGASILAGNDGKFTNVERFVEGRLRDGVVLLTAACWLLLVYRLAAVWANRRFPAPANWIARGWCAFVCLNLFAGVASHTLLFWCLLFNGKDRTINYTQYQIKQRLLKEAEARSQAVLMGASQTRTQIDPKVLNDRLGAKVWTTELHFPGSTPYDMGLCLERLPKARVDYIITYFSEANFFGQHDDGRLMYFFGCRDLRHYCELGQGKPPFDRYMVAGLLGDVFPLYRVWEPLVARAWGWRVANKEQERYDAALDTNLVSRAHEEAKGMYFVPDYDFQKQAFMEFAKMCRERGCRLIVCCGQMNPILERALDPRLRPSMLSFLREQAAKDPNIVLLDESQLPPQVESDYEDLTHVNHTNRLRFSQFIGDKLEALAQGKSR